MIEYTCETCYKICSKAKDELRGVGITLDNNTTTT